MAKTRKKIARIHWDDLEDGTWVSMSWNTSGPGDSVIVHSATGIFRRFKRLPSGEYLAVMRVIERVNVTPPGAFRRKFELRDRGPLEFSTRDKPEFSPWNGK